MEDNDPTQPGGPETHAQIDDSRLAIEQAIADRVQKSQSADFNAFNEDTGEIIPNALATSVPDEPADESKDEPKTEPAKAEPRMVSIVVDGQTIEVEESRILEAGKRTLQKTEAADRRLQEAAEKTRQADEYLRRAQQLSPRDAAPQTTAPPQDAPQQREPATFTPEMLDRALELKLYNRDAQKAAAKFREDFPEIATDPHLMNMAGAMEQQRLETVAALGESAGDPFESYRKHGDAIRTWMTKLTGAQPTADLIDKAERKRTISAVPAVNAKAPTPQAPKEPSVQELIEQERNARRGRPVQGYAVLNKR